MKWKVVYQKILFPCICCGSETGVVYGMLNGAPILASACHGKKGGERCDYRVGGSIDYDTLEIEEHHECYKCTKKENEEYKIARDDLFITARKLFDHAIEKYSHVYCFGNQLTDILRYHIAMDFPVGVYEVDRVIDFNDIAMLVPILQVYYKIFNRTRLSEWIYFVTTSPEIESRFIEMMQDKGQPTRVLKRIDPIMHGKSPQHKT